MRPDNRLMRLTFKFGKRHKLRCFTPSIQIGTLSAQTPAHFHELYIKDIGPLSQGSDDSVTSLSKTLALTSLPL